MWYAIQTTTGQESQTITMCKTLIDASFFQGIFYPKTELMKRYEGAWHKEIKPMFPGYIFAITDQPEELHQQFQKVPKLTKLLGTDNVPVALSESEVMLLKKVTNQEHVAEMSVGVIEGDRLIVKEGPLMGIEGLVKRVNRHKRVAVVGVEMFGRLVEMTLGLEVVEKKGSGGS